MVELFELAQAYPGAGLAWAGVAGLGLYFTVVWLAVGRDPKPGVIVPVYRPPDDLPPAEMRYLREKICDDQAVACALMGLAAKGYASIQTFAKGAYSLSFKTGTDPLSESEHCVLDAAGPTSFNITNLNYKRIQALFLALDASLIKKYHPSFFTLNLAFSLFGAGVMAALMIAVHFVSGRPFDAQSAGSIALTVWCFFLFIVPLDLLLKRKRLWTHRVRILVTAILGFVPLVLISIFSSRPFFETVSVVSVLTTLAVLVMLCLTVQFAGFLFATTRKGQDLIDRIEGFRLYLALTEIPRLNSQCSADKTPEPFDCMLAYALALDCEQPWAGAFANTVSFASHAPNAKMSSSTKKSSSVSATFGFSRSMAFGRKPPAR